MTTPKKKKVLKHDPPKELKAAIEAAERAKIDLAVIEAAHVKSFQEGVDWALSQTRPIAEAAGPSHVEQLEAIAPEAEPAARSMWDRFWHPEGEGL